MKGVPIYSPGAIKSLLGAIHTGGHLQSGGHTLIVSGVLGGRRLVRQFSEHGIWAAWSILTLAWTSGLIEGLSFDRRVLFLRASFKSIYQLKSSSAYHLQASLMRMPLRDT